MNKTLVLTSLLIALMALAIVPVQGFHHPSSTDDLNYETFGPRADQVLMKIYGSYGAEYLAFKAQEIDLMDWPLAAGDYAELESIDPTHATYSPAGYKDFGIWEIDINNQQYPTDVLSFRQALSHLVDKEYFINTYVGATVAVKADSPTAHLSAWYNPYCDDLYNLAPRTTVTPFPDDLPDFQAAYNLLVADLGAPVTDPEDAAYVTWLWPAKPDDPHGYVNLPNHLLVFARSEDPNRANLGAWIKSTLEVDMPKALFQLGLPKARIHVDLYTVPRSECKREVMGEYRYHLYTGGWGLTRDPDNLAFCYASYQCWKPTYYSPNYPCYNNPLFDTAWDNAEAQPTAALAVPYVYECQKIIMDDAGIIPVWLTAGYKAYLSKWDGVVNMAGRGEHNFWTLMNARLRGGAGMGDTIRYGFMNDISSLSPIHASWVWDWYVMENIYDSMISFNPYNVAEDIPWMASWEIGTWADGTKTKLTFHLRSDIKWQDVPPKVGRKYNILPTGATGVPVTTKDVAFTIISIRDNPDAWNQFLVADVANVTINDAVLGGSQMYTPYGYPNDTYPQAPMDVYGLSSVPTQDIIVYYNILSPWITLHWVGGLPIMPYHIWYWVPWWDYDNDGAIDTWLYDPEVEDTLYGSGPYIFDHRSPGIEILMKAFKVGASYKGITSTCAYMNSILRYYYRIGAQYPSADYKIGTRMWYSVQTPGYIALSFPEILGGQEFTGDLYYVGSDVHVATITAVANILGDGFNTAIAPTGADGEVGPADLYWMYAAYGAAKNTLKWNSTYGWNVDIVGSTLTPPAPPDGSVGFADLFILARNYGCGYGKARLLSGANAGGTTIIVNHVNGFKVGTQITIGFGATSELRTITAIAIGGGTATFTLDAPLANPHAALEWVLR